MAVIETWLRQDLKGLVSVRSLQGQVFSLDNGGNLIGVKVTKDGQPVTLTGTVTGYCILSDGQTVTVTGSGSSGIQNGNEAYVVLPQLVYSVPGQISIVIKLTSGSTTTTLAACTGYVYRSRTSNEVVPSGTPIPDLATLEEVIQNANTATNSANTAATEARNVNVAMSKSGKVITITTTNRNNTNTTETITEPSLTVTKEGQTITLTATDADGTTEVEYDAVETEEVDEIRDDVTELKSAKAPIIMESISTPADVQAFSDGADGMPVKSLSVDIDPVQDLHGYDNPWPAGGGVNILDPLLKFAAGTYLGGVTLATSDGYTISVSGTSTETGNITAPTIPTGDCVVYPAGTYTSVGATLFTYKADGSWYSNRQAGTWTADEPFIVRSCYIQIVSGTTYNFTRFIAMAKGSTAPTAWSPYSNICPISGHSSATVTRTGINLWDGEIESGYYDVSNNGAKADSASWKRSKNPIPCSPSTDIYFYNGGQTTAGFGALLFFDADGNQISYKTSGIKNSVVTTPENAKAMAFYAKDEWIGNISINYPSTDTDYHLYQGISVQIPLGQTVYGGTLTVNQDGNWEMVVDHADLDLGTIPSWAKVTTSRSHWRFYAYLNTAVQGAKLYCSNYKWITASAQYIGEQGVATQASGSNVLVMVSDEAYSDTAEFKTAMSGVHLVYELSTPVTYQLTNQQVIELLKGSNNIWADTGKINAVDYPADTKLYIDKKFTELQALVLEN